MAKRVDEILTPDRGEVTTFLDTMHPGQERHLVAIPETGKLKAKSFLSSQSDEMLEWVIKNNRTKHNIYWHVNPLKDGIKNRKAKKENIDRVTAFHVDLDDPSDRALESLKQFEPRPTVIIFSGGGYQAFWLLDEPLADLEKAALINKGIATKLGADDCFNVDRIMRVPGTINWPNTKKRAAGRSEAVAYVV
jgi:DNA primase RepB-like protein